MNGIPLLCLPFAGSGASFFNDWKTLTNFFEIISIQLPGREQRFIEEPYRNVNQAVSGIAQELGDGLKIYPRMVIFGHSLGAVLAYELSRRLIETNSGCVSLLIISGSPGPGNKRKNLATGLEDTAFINRIMEFAGYSHPALEDPNMRELLLPLLRADVEMHENYIPASEIPLQIPVMVVRGQKDELVSSDQLDQWQSVTVHPLYKLELPGGHMYLTERPLDLLKNIEKKISSIINNDLEILNAACG